MRSLGLKEASEKLLLAYCLAVLPHRMFRNAHPTAIAPVMKVITDRRRFLIGSIAVLSSACVSSQSDPYASYDLTQRLAALESSSGGRLGVHIIDTEKGKSFGWRDSERFPHASSFKLSLAAMLLARADQGLIDLQEVLRWNKDDLLAYSPVTKDRIEEGMSVAALAKGALVTSDNTAANVLLKRFGGPAELTRFWRSIGDDVSRLDRYEPDLNVVPIGTERDTTTPLAMAKTTAVLVTGDVLSPSSQTILRSWMIKVENGSNRIRNGFPTGWVTGDKTGTALTDARHTYVDLAFGGPAKKKPIIVAAYFEPNLPATRMDSGAEGVLAQVGLIAADALSS